MHTHVGGSSSGLGIGAHGANAPARDDDPYRALFRSLRQPALIATLRRDARDGIVVDANPALSALAGRSDATGCTLRDTLPELAALRLDALADAANDTPLLLRGQRFELHVVRAGDAEGGTVLVVLHPVAPSSSRDAFEVRLLDAIRALADPDAIQSQVCALLGDYLRANRVFYAEVEADGDTVVIRSDHADALPSMVGSVQLADFGSYVTRQLHGGTTVVLRNAAADPAIGEAQRTAFARIGVRGVIGVPLVKDGRLVAVLSVHQSTPRDWTAAEIALVEDVAERTWDAVQRAHADARRRAAEERYLALFNAIDQGFCTIDVQFDADGHAVDYRFVEVSPSFERQTGIADAVGRSMREIAPDHDVEWFEVYGRVAATGVPVRFEGCSTPLQRWWSVYAFRVQAPEPNRIALLFNDITPRKQAEHALRNRAAQVQTLIDQAPIGVYLVDADFRVRHVNPITARAAGDVPGGLDGRDYRDIVRLLFGEAGADDVVREFTRTLETGEPHVVDECMLRRRDRAAVECYAWRIDRITLPDGRHGVVCYFRDVSADVRARQHLSSARRHSERQRRLYETILDNTPDLAYVFDREHRFVYANRVLLQLWGKTWDEAIGRTCHALGYEPWHAAMHDREIEQVVRTGQPVRGEVPFTGTSGRRIYDYIFAPVFDARGCVEAIVGTTRDVTAYRETEQAVDAARRAAEAANHAKDRFLAMLSHELRTPLTPVLMTLGMLDRRADLPADVSREIGLMRRNVEVEVRLIDDLLDVSRVIADKLPLHRERVDWNQAVRDACDTCRPLFDEKRIRLRCDYGRACGDVYADPVRLQQVLWNILRNAAKFTPERQDVDVETGRDAANVWVRVRDTGIGIIPELLTTIFDAFEQGETAITRRFGGMGLGLAISKSLVDLHGGTLTASSDGPGRGAAFTVTLPVHARTAGAHDAVPQPARSGATALHILAVEDHADTSAALVRFLELRGHRVAVAHTIEAALAALERDRFDLLISDIGLPDGTGYDLMRQAGARYGIRGIAISGFGMDEDIRRSFDAGFGAHVLKPVDIGVLERTIGEVVGRA